MSAPSLDELVTWLRARAEAETLERMHQSARSSGVPDASLVGRTGAPPWTRGWTRRLNDESPLRSSLRELRKEIPFDDYRLTCAVAKGATETAAAQMCGVSRGRARRLLRRSLLKLGDIYALRSPLG